MSSKKRPRGDGDDAAPAPAAGATIGQQTSHIRNKLVRSETYAKLKHKKEVSMGCAQAAAATDSHSAEQLPGELATLLRW
jgi:hypothetical protein